MKTIIFKLQPEITLYEEKQNKLTQNYDIIFEGNFFEKLKFLFTKQYSQMIKISVVFSKNKIVKSKKVEITGIWYCEARK